MKRRILYVAIVCVLLYVLGFIFAAITHNVNWLLVNTMLLALVLFATILGFTLFDYLDPDHDWFEVIRSNPIALAIFMGLVVLAIALAITKPLG